MRSLSAFALTGLLMACHPNVTRADQDNFTFHAGSTGVEPFVAALERRLGRSAHAQNLDFSDSDRTQMFELSGSGVIAVVNPIPDDRCNPNAPWHSTYKQREYRIDLVYRTRSQAERQSAKRILTDSAKEVGHTLVPFKEC